MDYFLIHFKKFTYADYIIKFVKSHFSQMLTDLLSYKTEECHQVVSLTHEPLSQLGILSCHSYRACVEMTLAHHYTAQNNKRTGSKAKLFSTKERSHDHI